MSWWTTYTRVCSGLKCREGFLLGLFFFFLSVHWNLKNGASCQDCSVSLLASAHSALTSVFTKVLLDPRYTSQSKLQRHIQKAELKEAGRTTSPKPPSSSTFSVKLKHSFTPEGSVPFFMLVSLEIKDNHGGEMGRSCQEEPVPGFSLSAFCPIHKVTEMQQRFFFLIPNKKSDDFSIQSKLKVQYPCRPVTPKPSDEAHSHDNIRLSTNKHTQSKAVPQASLVRLHNIFVPNEQLCVHPTKKPVLRIYKARVLPNSFQVLSREQKKPTHNPPLTLGLTFCVGLECTHWGYACR